MGLTKKYFKKKSLFFKYRETVKSAMSLLFAKVKLMIITLNLEDERYRTTVSAHRLQSSFSLQVSFHRFDRFRLKSEKF
jgi:hypothetical protein